MGICRGMQQSGSISVVGERATVTKLQAVGVRFKAEDISKRRTVLVLIVLTLRNLLFAEIDGASRFGPVEERRRFVPRLILVETRCQRASSSWTPFFAEDILEYGQPWGYRAH